ncbi:meprin A subunit beta-like [Engraulis encrasicolus]|uniref:meprin A subunit beta-like n=1 Tax=Engraulis encrasicolus TaxID=184585 RepID=UPI002FD03335
MKCFFFFVIVALQPIYTLPVNSSIGRFKEMYHADIFEINKDLDLFEGDIKLSHDSERVAASDSSMRWSIPIPVLLDSSLDLTGKSTVTKAIEQYRLKTCIDFKMRDTEPHYLLFKKDDGCWSYVGFTQTGEQPVSIGDYCQEVATVEHELLHALGFWHEHTRPDRDEHVTIQWGYIDPAKSHNFDKRAVAESTLQGSKYDYKSVMHYSKTSFSNGNGDTIVTKDPNYQEIIGQRHEMSPTDVWEVNSLYGCTSSVTFLDGCTFEKNMQCELTACSNTDETMWTRLSSAVYGPWQDHSDFQSHGGVGHFVHFSTAMGMAGDGGIIKTRRMTPHRDFQCLEFFYYYNGADSDQLNIWLREFESGSDTIGASTLVGQITGDPANYWQLQHLQLRSTKIFQIEFEAVKGLGESMGGFSLDDINLSETVCPHHVWRISNFREAFQRSPKFYSAEGYRYRVYMTYADEYVGLYVGLVSGQYDDSLQWPAPEKQITVQIMEQTSSILHRMSKQVTFALYSTINGQPVTNWDNPTTVGSLYNDIDGQVYEGPPFGRHDFMSLDHLEAGSFAQGSECFLLTSFEDVVNQLSPLIPTAMAESSVNNMFNIISPCVEHKFRPNKAAVCAPSEFIVLLVAVNVMLTVQWD